ncbi:anchored repeat-type ABC transporter permease subunit [Streptomyces sp. TS71-3]|uniref:anchored repeat-type ABC transporter permease subunit n=1 Tax=Streptomyces sp. TS71-3 TaxID=2733862 RepID=UPI001B074330|nr:anchored repeat-type ABC transporter permease subunit [Streptomyces sp. TS71-3]GHJ41241.1 hypothetical protein Sm713_68500 [Streptomyces sp. TS71-3]
MSPIEFLTDLLNPDLAFLPKALAVALMSSLVCGVVGTYVVLRGMAFIGDAVSHAVFPGLAVAFAVEGNLVLGGTLAGVATAVLVAVFSQNRRLNESSVIGVFFVAAFALGVVIISQAPGYAGSLEQFLFGSITGIPTSDLYIDAVTSLVILAVLFALHKELVTISLDRESARAMGIPVFRLDLVLYVLVTLAVVISVQTIGNILVLALLVTPAATARMLTDRLGVMMVLSPAAGALGALVGLYVSWGWDLPTGGTIVLVLTADFLLAWFLAPRQGLIAKAWRRRARAGLRTSAPRPRTATGEPPEAAGTAAPPVAGEGGPPKRLQDPSPSPPPRPSGSDMEPAARRSAADSGAAPRRRWMLPAVGAALAVLGTGALVAAVLDPSAQATSGGSPRTAPPRTPSPAPSPAGTLPSSSGTPIAELPDPAWVTRTAEAAGIPERALTAYAGASLAVAATDSSCHLGWNTLAGIGEVESRHGTMNGAGIGHAGEATPTIIGVPLNGHHVARVPDTDDGTLDGDRTWDHAVGPMQFIPATWTTQAKDGNGDGRRDVNNIDDAALAAGVYLCRTGGDLAVAGNWIAAINAYDSGADYNRKVAEAANRYASVR